MSIAPTDISPSITPHTIVLCVEKRERGIGMQAMLGNAGYKVVVVLSLYDALKCIAQDMPHLVIVDAILADGSAGMLYDRLQQHETLKKTPILVCVLKKAKEELAALQGRQFAGYYFGAFDPKSFMAKFNEVIFAHAAVSPYFVTAASVGMDADMTISIEANVVGRTGDQVVSRSATEVDPSASMTCVPNSGDLGTAVFRLASNLRDGDEVFNLFPIHRIGGVGRKWVMALPEIKIGSGGEKSQSKVHKVLFYEPDDTRFEAFHEILRGYGIELIHARSLTAASVALRRDAGAIDAIFLHELKGDAEGIEWTNVYGKLAQARKPPLIVGTSSSGVRSTAAIRYLKRPFGLGLFVETLQASFEKASDIAAAVGKNAATGLAGVSVRYQAAASLVGLDETGGILQVGFPLLKGSRLTINHHFLQQAWDGQGIVSVTGSAAVPSRPDVWHVRFEAIGAGMSKVKYWDKLSKQLREASGVMDGVPKTA